MCVCEINELTAAEIMTPNVVCLNEDLDLHECEKILLDNGISGAPVVDVNGTLQGVLSKTDLVTHHHVAGEDGGTGGANSIRLEGVRGAHVMESDMVTARDMMTPVPCVASEWATVGELAVMMVQRQFHRVVICNGREVVGIVTSLDILKAMARGSAKKGLEGIAFP